jgi:hypothetical protein
MLITWVVTTHPQSNMPITAKKECQNPANSNYFGSNSYSFLLYYGTTINLTVISHKDKDAHFLQCKCESSVFLLGLGVFNPQPYTVT